MQKADFRATPRREAPLSRIRYRLKGGISRQASEISGNVRTSGEARMSFINRATRAALYGLCKSLGAKPERELSSDARASRACARFIRSSRKVAGPAEDHPLI